MNSAGRGALAQYKFVFNLRGDDGASTGGLSVDTNLGWKGAEKYIAIVPQIFDLWADPQERYDIFMNNFTETTWTMPMFGQAIKEIMQSYIKYPPRKLQAGKHPRDVTLPQYQLLKSMQQQLEKEGFQFSIPVD